MAMIIKANRKGIFAAVLAVSVAIFSGTTCLAKSRPETIEIGFSAGGLFTHKDNGPGHPAARLDMGYNLGQLLGVELSLLNDIHSPNGSPSFSLFMINSIFNLGDDFRISPYVVAGAGTGYFSDAVDQHKSKFLANLGGGMKYFISRGIALKADIRNYLTPNKFTNNISLTIGLTYVFDFSSALETHQPDTVQQDTAPSVAPAKEAEPSGVKEGDGSHLEAVPPASEPQNETAPAEPAEKPEKDD